MGMNQCKWNTNYFKGSNPENWHTEIPNFYEIIYPELWDSIDLVYQLKNGAVKYDLILYPGADPSEIKFRIDGANKLSINSNGDLVLGNEYCNIHDTRPVAFYQDNPKEQL